MDRSGATSRASRRPRQPLADASSRANIYNHPAAAVEKSTNGLPPSPDSSVGVPHHESLPAHGALTVRNTCNTPENKRLSAVTDENYDSKRSSQVSTTSTNASAKGRRRKTHIGPWLLGSDIGKGGCGKVRKVKHSLTGQVAAAKIISKKIAEKARAESLMNLVEAQKRGNGSLGLPNSHVMPFGVEREVVIMKLLEHPNVVKLYDVWENRSELYLIMEHVDGGELFEYVEKVGYMREDETVWVFRQIVAALLHCHRLGIHHRDLKPENILLDLSEHPQVKLIDFGMAALQPQGQLLTTPCGSIHYAAPEVFERNYDGSKVDVWSLGIILYVMLTGNTPFAYDAATMKNDTERWYRLIKAGRFDIPDHISPEAADLIRKMLVPDPLRRISLEGCWHHTLVQTYNQVWSSNPRENHLEYWIGAKPVIENWNVRTRADIDREILINLRCLWHSVDEEYIVSMILNKDPNQEKYFYSALQKHRDEQLENYVGTVDTMGYSTSDYHHVKAPSPEELPPVPASAYSRTRSQFSILDDRDKMDIDQSQSTLKAGTGSIRSYDPYRAPHDPLVNGKGQYSVTVHPRGQSLHGRKRSQTTNVRGQPGSLRVQALKSDARRPTTSSSRQSLRAPSPSPRGSRARSRSSSRMSVASCASSYLPSSPPSGAVRAASRTKRPVQFVSSKRNSVASLRATLPDLTEESSPKTPQTRRKAQLVQLAGSSPAPPTAMFVKSKKQMDVEASPMIRVRRPRTHSQMLDTEARKVSSELEKYCEEVFYRSSGQSSQSSAMTNAVDTPPSSVSQRGSGGSYRNANNQAYDGEDLGNTDTPNTYITKELSETRKRLAARYANDDGARSSSYHEVLAHLDSLLSIRNGDSRRIATGVDASKTGDRMAFLPMISEEARAPEYDSPVDYDRFARQVERTSDAFRQGTFTEPTIRVVDQSSPTKPAPLVIRKSSGTTSASGSASSGISQQGQRYYSGQTTGSQISERKPQAVPSNPLGPVFEDVSKDSLKDADAKGSKRRHWFSRKRMASAESDSQKPKTSNGHDFTEFDDRLKLDTQLPTRRGGSNSPIPETSNFPITSADNKPGFFAFLRKKRAHSGNSFGNMAMGGDDDEITTETSFTAVSVDSNTRQRLQPSEAQKRIENRDLGVQQNWLARFFNIKPASKVMCFSRGRGVARQELVRLLRSWRMYGMKDVVLDRGRNLIWGRLASPNYLGIKEVQFVIELFVVLEHGRRAHLSLARFTQRSGAASSFRKVVDTVDVVLKGKGLLVEEGVRRREMEAILLG
ncbi:hypothetical protein FH972_021542 [Carpinus fangiana]|uniref:non-specific serine/threonine protein kinase n=1 Tax=Carpinus fangiana TaxID=176857 RepID=A0A5N6KQA5_9ROSI|nr:hypothetical protein FH972_021542 [Carpinus fangiana]